MICGKEKQWGGEWRNGMKYGDPLKIVCYGDSITYGYETLFTQAKNNYPALLQEKLQKRYNNPDIKVINCGKNAMTSEWGVKNLEILVLAEHPDLVVVMFGINDAIYVGDKRRYLENLEQMYKTLEANGINFLFLTPTPILTLHAKKVKLFAGLAKKNFIKDNIPFIDMQEIIRKKMKQGKNTLAYLPDLLHPVSHYNDIAEEVFHYLTKNDARSADAFILPEE